MRSILTIISIFIFSIAQAQDYGYFGQKNTITINASFAPKLIPNLLNRNRDFNEKAYLNTFGGSIRYERQLKSKYKQIGFEFGVYQTSNRLSGFRELFFQNGFNYYTGQLIAHPSIKSTIFNPMITFSRSYQGNQTPIGLINTMGFGAVIASHKVAASGDYTSVRQESSMYPASSSELESAKAYADSRLYGPDMFTKKIFGVKFFWQTAYNMPLTKNLIWTIAVRGNITIFTPLIASKGFDQDFMINSASFNRSFSLHELMNILEINSGFKIAF